MMKTSPAAIEDSAKSKTVDAPRTLRAVGLVKHYRGRRAVDAVDVHVDGGEVVGLLGVNGAGKTTSFNMIIGLVRHDAGEIFLGDEKIGNLPMHLRARKGLGYLPQEHSVFRKLTVEQNLFAVLQAAGKLRAPAQRELCESLLREFGVLHLRDQPAMQLSGGEKRRVEIARALALAPTFILLDEPFAGVDPIAVREIRAIVAALKTRDIGVLITDHNVRETLGICDRAYIMHDGKVLAHGDPQKLTRMQSVRRAYLGDDFKL